MLNDYLVKEYGYDEPIFINNLQVQDMSKKALRQAISRLTKSGSLSKFDTGIYYIPKPDRLLKRSFLDTTKVVIKKYITDGKQVYGYFTGLTASNQLGLTSQVPALMEITTNVEASRGRTIELGNRILRIQKPRIDINSENYQILQLLDILQEIDKWSDLQKEEVIFRLKEQINSKKLKREELNKCISVYPGKTAQRLIEWELIYEFA